MDIGERIRRNNSYSDPFVSQVANRTENRDYGRAYASFIPHLKPSGVVLDLGCGTGIHLAHFKALNIPSLGVEPSAEMRKVGAAAGLDMIEGTFEGLSGLNLPEVSGVWCAASLLHVPREEFHAVAKSIASLLPPAAPLFLTVRLGDGAKWDQFDSETGDAARFIQLFSEDFLLDTLTVCNLTPVEKWIEDSTWGRPSRWISIVACMS